MTPTLSSTADIEYTQQGAPDAEITLTVLDVPFDMKAEGSAAGGPVFDVQRFD